MARRSRQAAADDAIDQQQLEFTHRRQLAAQALAEIDKLGLTFALDDGCARQQTML